MRLFISTVASCAWRRGGAPGRCYSPLLGKYEQRSLDSQDEVTEADHHPLPISPATSSWFGGSPKLNAPSANSQVHRDSSIAGGSRRRGETTGDTALQLDELEQVQQWTDTADMLVSHCCITKWDTWYPLQHPFCVPGASA